MRPARRSGRPRRGRRRSTPGSVAAKPLAGAASPRSTAIRAMRATGGQMDLKLLRRRCEARHRGLGAAVPFDAHQFCRALEQQRQRPIVLRPLLGRTARVGSGWRGPAATSSSTTRPRVPCTSSTSSCTRLSHLLCGHRTRSAGRGRARAAPVPGPLPADGRARAGARGLRHRGRTGSGAARLRDPPAGHRARTCRGPRRPRAGRAASAAGGLPRGRQRDAGMLNTVVGGELVLVAWLAVAARLPAGSARRPCAALLGLTGSACWRWPSG